MSCESWVVSDRDGAPLASPDLAVIRLRLLRLSAIVADRREIEAHRSAGSRLMTHDVHVGGRS
jgi:hypothetical protein